MKFTGCIGIVLLWTAGMSCEVCQPWTSTILVWAISESWKYLTNMLFHTGVVNHQITYCHQLDVKCQLHQTTGASHPVNVVFLQGNLARVPLNRLIVPLQPLLMAPKGYIDILPPWALCTLSSFWALNPCGMNQLIPSGLLIFHKYVKREAITVELEFESDFEHFDTSWKLSCHLTGMYWVGD